jgi:DNA-binding transcriptional ArsR family regulator
MDRPSSAPSTPADATVSGDTPEVVGVDSEAADDIISALSSQTARDVLARLHEAPDTHSGLAERLDTTIQTVEYHLSNLEAAGLVEVDGVTTSEQGQEMDVYAPTDGPLVVLAGDDEADEGLRAALRRTLGGVGVLALASLVVDRLLRAPGTPSEPPGPIATPEATPEEPAGDTGTAAPGTNATGGPEATPTAADGVGTGTPTPTPAPEATGTPTPTPAPEATGTPTPTPAATGTPTEIATETPAATGTPPPTSTPAPEATEVAKDAATASPTPTPTFEAAEPGLLDGLLATVPPGLVFFLGGLLGILIVVALTHRGRLSWR